MSHNWNSFGFKDQLAIVTGTSQATGRTLAIALAEAGPFVNLVLSEGDYGFGSKN